MKNGISTEDLTKSYLEGFDKGFEAASPEITRTAYAAMALALRDEFKFGRDRIVRVLTAVNNHILNTLDSQDAIDKVYHELKLSLHLNDPLQPIQEEET